MASVCRATERRKQEIFNGRRCCGNGQHDGNNNTEKRGLSKSGPLLAFTRKEPLLYRRNSGPLDSLCLSAASLSLSVSRARNLIILVDAVVGMSGPSCLSDKQRCRGDDRQQESLQKWFGSEEWTTKCLPREEQLGHD
jgi:hypothetical protein